MEWEGYFGMRDVYKWDHRYLTIAKNVSEWSKDPSRKIGSITVGSIGQILSQGYNGFPRGIDDHDYRLDNREEKLRYIVHAEMNAIYNATHSGISLNGSTLYVYGLPVCSECAKGVIQVGVKRVVMNCDKKMLDGPWGESWKLTKEMFNKTKVEYNLYHETGE